MEKVPLILGVLYNDTKVESVSFSYNFDNETITITGNSDLHLMTSALININSLDAVVYVSCSSKKRVREETDSGTVSAEKKEKLVHSIIQTRTTGPLASSAISTESAIMYAYDE